MTVIRTASSFPILPHRKSVLCSRAATSPPKTMGWRAAPRAASPPTIKFVIVDFTNPKNNPVTGTVTWENTDVCPLQTFNIEALKTVTIEYTAKCGKLKSIAGNDGAPCAPFGKEIAQPITTFYVKKDTTINKCEFSTSPKILLGK